MIFVEVILWKILLGIPRAVALDLFEYVARARTVRLEDLFEGSYVVTDVLVLDV